MENKKEEIFKIKVEDLEGYIIVSKRTFYKVIKEQKVSFETSKIIVLFSDVLEKHYPKLFNKAMRELKWNYYL